MVRVHRVAWAVALAGVLLVSGPWNLSPPAAAEAWIRTDMGTPPGGNVRLRGVAVGDGDRDGASEVYFTAMPGGGLFRYSLDAQSGSWSIKNVATSELNADALALGDGDDSGNRELYALGLVRGGPPRGRMALFQLYYDSSGWHQETVATTASPATGNALAIGDGNNDSRKEVFSCGSDGHIYMYYKSNEWNSQDIGSAVPPPGQPAISMEGLAVGDGDNDGYPEVYGSAADGRVYRFSYTGSAWVRSDVGAGDTSPQGSSMAALAIADADGDGKNEVYGASWANATIYMFKYDTTAGAWIRTALVSLGNMVNALCLAAGDVDSDGLEELYAGASNNQVYRVFIDSATGKWVSASIGSGNGPVSGVAVGSGAGVPSSVEVYAACTDGHGYQFLLDRFPPANPRVWSDTHPEPGTWYPASVVHVLWEDVGRDPSGIDGYSISWDNNPATVPDAVKELEESVHEATSPALSPGKWYFHIRARDNSLNWNATATHFGPICIGTAPDTAPPIISNVRVTGISDRLAVVSWSTNEPSDGLVEYGTDTGYGRSVSDPGFFLEHSLTLIALSPSTTYHFRVGSRDASGNGPSYSEDMTFTTLASPDLTPPVISNVKVTGITDRLAVVTWETDEPADSMVEWGPTPSYGVSTSDVKLVLLHELTLSGLEPSTIYHFRVGSKDASGNGPSYSEDLSFTTLASPDTEPPHIMNLRVEGVTGSSAIVLWETDEPADSFVEYGQTSSYGLSAADRSYVLVHSVALLGLSPGVSYHLRVISADPSGNKGYSEDLSFMTNATPSAPDTRPPVISGLTVSGVSDTRAVVLWSTDELADSEVEYGTDTFYGLRASDPSLTTIHSVVLQGLRPSTEYHLRVKSTDASGNGPAVSGDVSFWTAGSPDTTAPMISDIRVVNVTSTTATILWRTSEPSNSFVEWGNSTAYGRSIFSSLYVLEHAIVLTGLKPGTLYHFRVSSTDPAGNKGGPSADQSFRTSGGTSAPAVTTSSFPWWLVALLLAVLVFIVAAAVLLGRRAPPARETGPVPPEPPSAGWEEEEGVGGAGGTGGFARSDAEEPEVLQMDGAAAPAAGGGAPDSGAPLQIHGESLPVSPGPGIPASVEQLPSQPSPPPPRRIRCQACGTSFPVYGGGTQRVTCPGCGRTGVFRGSAGG
ncbi:MAG: fibronectin type III domain-containing protein [Thermoplasmata archaeon]